MKKSELITQWKRKIELAFVHRKQTLHVSRFPLRYMIHGGEREKERDKVRNQRRWMKVNQKSKTNEGPELSLCD